MCIVLACSIYAPFANLKKGSWAPQPCFCPSRAQETQPFLFQYFWRSSLPQPPLSVCHHQCTLRACTSRAHRPTLFPAYPFPCSTLPPFWLCSKQQPHTSALPALSAGLCTVLLPALATQSTCCPVLHHLPAQPGWVPACMLSGSVLHAACAPTLGSRCPTPPPKPMFFWACHLRAARAPLPALASDSRRSGPAAPPRLPCLRSPFCLLHTSVHFLAPFMCSLKRLYRPAQTTVHSSCAHPASLLPQMPKTPFCTSSHKASGRHLLCKIALQ